MTLQVIDRWEHIPARYAGQRDDPNPSDTGTQQDGVRFYAIQNRAQFKMHELSISGNFHVMFLNHGDGG